ncbi:MAG: NTP transferase domain-containing protein [Tenuifilaceae bacterium]
MTIKNKKYSAIILSAGKSTRMGVPKFSLKFNSSTTFLENLINEYKSFGCEQIVVVLNQEGATILDKLNLNIPLEVKVVINQHPEWERFYSLKLGAKGLKNITPTFVSNIDNPFVDSDIFQALALSIRNADYIHPSINGKGGHPILLSEKIISDLTTESKDENHLKEFLGRYSKLSVEVDDDKIFLNINTDEEYRRLFNF